jgi:hypothetical protein
MARFEFGSDAWVAEVHGLVRRLLDGADLGGIEFRSCEAYLNPPPHLARPGGLGWHMIVSGGRLTLGAGPLAEADRIVHADYATIAPLASIAYRDNPAGEAKVREAARKAAEAGLLKAWGDKPPSAVLPQLAPLHDMVADITAIVPG